MSWYSPAGSNRHLPQPDQQPTTRPTDIPAHEATLPPTRESTVLYTPAQAAQRLQVAESWLRRRATARTIPCTFLGKHLRFSPADLAAIITQHARPATGKPARRARPRPRPPSNTAARDLSPGPDQSVDASRHDHQRDGSSTWPG